MSIAEEVIKALTAVISPELKALQERVDANHREATEKLDAFRRETNLRFDALNSRFDELLQRLALERRIEAVERELDAKRTA